MPEKKLRPISLTSTIKLRVEKRSSEKEASTRAAKT
jgi:hypothetical protein